MNLNIIYLFLTLTALQVYSYGSAFVPSTSTSTSSMSSSSSNSNSKSSSSSTSNSIRLSSSLSTPATTSKSNVKVSSLADSFQDGTIEVSREYPTDDSDDSSSSESLSSSTHSLHYRIHNRMNLSSQKAAPILVLHGGPGVPSDYLYPLKSVVPYRSIVFYDQLGSGRSPGPDNINAYSIEKSIDDLEYLIKKLSLRRFHLYGQSFGGILAFEYLKRIVERNIGSDGDTDDRDQPECLSVILSSSPTNVEQVENSANTLIENLLSEDDDKTTIAERFRQQNQCRTVDKPQSLIDAYNHAGTIWRGTDVIQEWKATKPMDDAKRMPSAMVMRGEYDFVSQECVDGWKKVFNHPFVRVKVLDGCSHHGLLENGNAYGEIVDSYFAEYD